MKFPIKLAAFSPVYWSRQCLSRLMRRSTAHLTGSLSRVRTPHRDPSPGEFQPVKKAGRGLSDQRTGSKGAARDWRLEISPYAILPRIRPLSWGGGGGGFSFGFFFGKFFLVFFFLFFCLCVALCRSETCGPRHPRTYINRPGASRQSDDPPSRWINPLVHSAIYWDDETRSFSRSRSG